MNEELLRVLVVEDDPVDRLSIERAARQYHWHCDLRLVSSLQGALQVIERESFDVAIVDLDLDDGSGFDLLGGTNGMPVVICTGAGDELTAARSLRGGAFDYVIKDVEGGYLEELEPILRRAVQQRRSGTGQQRVLDHREALHRELPWLMDWLQRSREEEEGGTAPAGSLSRALEFLGELAGPHPPEPRRIEPLGAVLAGGLDRAAGDDPELRARVRLPDESPTLSLPPRRSRQLFALLLGFALRRLGDDGGVTVALGRDTGGWTVEIRDDGRPPTTGELDLLTAPSRLALIPGEPPGPLAAVTRLVLDLGGDLRIATDDTGRTRVFVGLGQPEAE